MIRSSCSKYQASLKGSVEVIVARTVLLKKIKRKSCLRLLVKENWLTKWISSSLIKIVIMISWIDRTKNIRRKDSLIVKVGNWISWKSMRNIGGVCKMGYVSNLIKMNSSWSWIVDKAIDSKKKSLIYWM